MHQYTDDSQIYGYCRANCTSVLSTLVSHCTTRVANWMRSDRLQLNADKTDVMCCSSARRTSSLPSYPINNIIGVDVSIVSMVRDLGVLIDSDLDVASHVRLVVSRCFAALRQLRKLRRFVSDDCFRSLAVALIHSRLDYGNFVMVGLPAYHQRLLQSVFKATARLTFCLRRYDHVTDALAILHWLEAPERMDYKLAVTGYRSLHGQPPSYPPCASMRGRSSQPSSAAVIFFGSAGGTSPPTDHRRPPIISGCSYITLELSALRRAVCAFSACLPLSAEDILVPAFIPGTYCLISFCFTTVLYYCQWSQH
jgi:hypothetical protein